MTIAALVLDFYDDASREGLRKLASPGPLGKLAFEALGGSELRELNDDQFALCIVTKTAQVLRKWPVNDPAHAWLAGQYFDQNHDKIAAPAQVVAARHIKIAADAYGVSVPDSVETLAGLYPDGMEGNSFVEGSEVHMNLSMPVGIEKSAGALPDDAYALVAVGADGELMRKYAMPDAASAAAAVAWFEKHASKLAPEFRPRMARSIVKRAQALGVDLAGLEETPQLWKYAAGGWNSQLAAHLEQRKSLVPRDEKAREILEKLATQIGQGDAEDFSKVLGAFDARFGLTRYYGRGIEDATSSSFGMSKAGSWSSEIDGEIITEADLKKAATRDSFKQYFGDAVKEAFVKDPVSIYESLPAPNKALIHQIARGLA
jgi:hypothetical protein